METSEEYFKYTVCNEIPAGRKRLRFIVDSIKKYCVETSLSEPNILDYGCGNGYFTIAIASLGYNIDGVDVDKDSIESSVSKNPFSNAKFYHIKEDENSISDVLKTKYYDIIISSEVLHWTEQPREYLRLTKNCLKETGIVVLTDENAFGPRETLGRIEQFLLKSRMLQFAIKFVRKLLGMTSSEKRQELYSANPDIIERQLAIRHNFSIFSIRKLFGDAGFEIIKERNSFFLFSVFGLGGEAKIDIWDCKLADYLPRFMVSGWYFILKLKDSAAK